MHTSGPNLEQLSGKAATGAAAALGLQSLAAEARGDADAKDENAMTGATSVDVTHPLRSAWLARDVEGVVACFREDGAFHSPVIGGDGWIGRRSIARLMEVVFAVTAEHEFTSRFVDGATEVHGFSAKFEGRPVTGLIQIDLDADGDVRDLWVFVRPLTAVASVQAAMGAGLLAQQHRALGPAARPIGSVQRMLAGMIDWFGRLLSRRMNR